MLGFFSSSKLDHPLADPKELRRVLAELPALEPAAAVDEITTWLESLNATESFRPDQRFELISQLDEAVLLQARRLARDYVSAVRPTRAQERKLWQLNSGYWTDLARAYELCLIGYAAGGKGAEAMKSSLGLLHARLLHACACRLKWTQLRYGPMDGAIWALAGSSYLAAVAAGLDRRNVTIFPGTETTVVAEYTRMLVFHASSVNNLMPQEIEIAERLIAHCLPHFVLTGEVRPENVYWVDSAKPMPPARLAKLPEITSSLRFFSTGAAADVAGELSGETAVRGSPPAALNLGGQYPVEAVLAVLDHLAMNWSPKPPMRSHPRHRIKSRLAVVNGLPALYRRLRQEQEGGDEIEAWIVDDVSMGGMGAQMPLTQADWVRIGCLLGMQPEGGDNWLVGVIRRFSRETETQGSVGIETLSKLPRAVRANCGGLENDVVLLDPPEPGTIVRALLQDASWESNVALEFLSDGSAVTLRPAGLIGRGNDFVIGRYTVS